MRKQAGISQGAEKLVRALCQGFIPGITSTKSTWALAPEACFSPLSTLNRPFQQPVQSCRERNKVNVGLHRLRKNGEQEANSPKSFPQGLKTALILRNLRHG